MEEILKSLFSKNKQRLCLTTDLWTASTTSISYMVITRHFIDENWCLKRKLISSNLSLIIKDRQLQNESKVAWWNGESRRFSLSLLIMLIAVTMLLDTSKKNWTTTGPNALNLHFRHDWTACMLFLFSVAVYWKGFFIKLLEL